MNFKRKILALALGGGLLAGVNQAAHADFAYAYTHLKIDDLRAFLVPDLGDLFTDGAAENLGGKVAAGGHLTSVGPFEMQVGASLFGNDGNVLAGGPTGLNPAFACVDTGPADGSACGSYTEDTFAQLGPGLPVGAVPGTGIPSNFALSDGTITDTTLNAGGTTPGSFGVAFEASAEVQVGGTNQGSANSESDGKLEWDFIFSVDLAETGGSAPNPDGAHLLVEYNALVEQFSAVGGSSGDGDTARTSINFNILIEDIKLTTDKADTNTCLAGAADDAAREACIADNFATSPGVEASVDSCVAGLGGVFTATAAGFCVSQVDPSITNWNSTGIRNNDPANGFFEDIAGASTADNGKDPFATTAVTGAPEGGSNTDVQGGPLSEFRFWSAELTRGRDYSFDFNVTWSAFAESTAPEPGTLALMGASLVLLGGVARRRRS